jgi:prevent-host-death family protein
MYNAYVRPSRDLRNNFTELREIIKNHDHVIITNNGRGDAVLIDIEDYKAYEEYLHLRYVDEKLDEAERVAANPNAKWYGHEEFWKKVRDGK